MKVRDILVEDRYQDQWAKDKAAENRAKARQLKAAERAAARAAMPPKAPRPPRKIKPDLGHVWNIVQDAIADSFPDGDPIDHLPRDLDIEVIDKAVKLFAAPRGKKGKYGMYDYLADMWDSTQGDQVHDANVMLKNKDFQLFDHGIGDNFYQVDGGPDWKEDHKTWDKWDQVKITRRRNPWK